jgi:hypothetical protein
MQKLDDRQLGAFGGKKNISRQTNRPMPMMEPGALAKQEEHKKSQ